MKGDRFSRMIRDTRSNDDRMCLDKYIHSHRYRKLTESGESVLMEIRWERSLSLETTMGWFLLDAAWTRRVVARSRAMASWREASVDVGTHIHNFMRTYIIRHRKAERERDIQAAGALIPPSDWLNHESMSTVSHPLVPHTILPVLVLSIHLPGTSSFLMATNSFSKNDIIRLTFRRVRVNIFI